MVVDLSFGSVGDLLGIGWSFLASTAIAEAQRCIYFLDAKCVVPGLERVSWLFSRMSCKDLSLYGFNANTRDGSSSEFMYSLAYIVVCSYKLVEACCLLLGCVVPTAFCDYD